MVRDEDDQLSESTFVDLASGLVGDAEDELRRRLNEDVVPNASGEAIDAVLSGTMIGLARQDLTNAMTAAGEQSDQPVIHARERELQGGSVAIHLFVSNPEARVFRGDQSVLVRVGEWADEQFLGFPPGEVERLQGAGETDTVSEFMVYPKHARQPTERASDDDTITTDYPEDEDDADETDTSSEESSQHEQTVTCPDCGESKPLYEECPHCGYETYSDDDG